MYKVAIWLSEWESLIPEKAKLPEDFNEKNLKEYKKNKE